ncbi:LacI family DNA-binding transcriptional regulator [Microbacterium sp. STN6]|uniref:LacI family DNA-binding transcriptional regulator n=1 Tax=Microbacterium sp. STN6 TaxID=2995588 RepID=UPI002260F29D|nr:LacI family DNA-binding transcriptional regulator [Microbacterium sp. STN6]MCX7522519.1 LacI family DNA-binding transcriptional regulator [Microbacterium sp. STN6]
MSDATRKGTGRAQPSMSDVAKLAGVAIGTVSNTLNSPEKVTEATRRRVMAAIAELGFVRNDAARSLAAGTSTTVGLVVADLGNSFFVDIARGAEATVRQHGMNLLIANSDVDLAKQSNNLAVFEQARVAGVLLAPLDTPFVEVSARLTSNTPLVLVNYESRRKLYSGVVVDERRGGFLAARHVLDLGRRRLLFVGGPLSLRAVAERYEGAQRAVADVADATLDLVETHGQNIRHGKQAARELVARSNPIAIDGIVAASDLLAIGVIQVFDELADFDVPGDVAIVGYDNNHFASESNVPVSTVSQPGEEMGRLAAELLCEEIAGTAARDKQTVVLQPHLLPRRSSLGDAWRRD